MNFFDEQTWMERLDDLSSTGTGERTFRVGANVVDCRTGVVQAPGQTQRLRRKELELLTYLRKCSAPVAREQLLREVWNYSNVVTRTVDQTIATLRRKLNDDSTKPKYLLTVYGIGYQLRTQLES